MKAISTLDAIKKYSFPIYRTKICELTINYNCNARCVFCYTEDPFISSNLKLDLKTSFKYMLDSYKDGARIIQFIGGEPTVYENLDKLILMAKKVGYKAIQIVTNGIRLSDTVYFKHLIDAGLNSVVFSVHGAGSKIHDKVVGVNGAFDKIKKAELHLHLDGSMRTSTILDAFKEYNIKNEGYEEKNIEKYLSADESTVSLSEYLTKFDIPLIVLQYKNVIERTAYELFETLYFENYIYAEVRFAPHLHTLKGLTLEEIVESVLNGAYAANKKYKIEYGIILCIMRHMDLKYAYEILNLAETYKNKGVVGIDLAGDEKNYPVDIFEEVFKIAKLKNINFTIHAGEARGAESVEKAVKYGANRIGHGIRAYENEKLLKEIAAKEILLEICPTSNYQTKVPKDFSKYPIRTFLKEGIKISLNTDNRKVSNTTLEKEAVFLMKKFDISKEEIKKMLENSIAYSFADEEKKKEMLRRIKDE